MELVLQSDDSPKSEPLVQSSTTPENDAAVLEPVTCQPISPAPVQHKIRAEYMEDLIIFNDAIENQSDSEDDEEDDEEEDDDDDESASTDRILVLQNKETHRRFVYNTLPYDPKLKDFIKKSNRKYREWAETVSDFYYLEPAVHTDSGENFLSSLRNAAIKSRVLVTASVLRDFLASCKEGSAIGPYSRFFQAEEERHSVPVYSLESLVRENERWIVSNIVSPKRLCDLNGGVPNTSGKVPGPSSSKLFAPSAYPPPWPFEPFSKDDWHPREKFSNFASTPTLQQFIPRHLLPKILFVHDPWGLLCATNASGERVCKWVEKDDVVYTYRLRLSTHPDASDRYEEDLEEFDAQLNEEKAKIDAFLANPHSDTPMPNGMLYEPFQATRAICGPAKPPVYIVFPPKPPQPSAEAAHLYLSKGSALGAGNHSFVYSAEFEIPRSLVVDELLCKECVMNDARQILEEQDGKHGETRNAKWNDLCGRYILKVRGNPARMRKFGEQEYEISPDTHEAKIEYVGPYRVIQTKVGYQNLERAPYCEHLCEDNVHPLTVKARVAAKLSLKYDPQLANEAKNYQLFPKHFFEHYNGFTVIEPFKNPIPTGAIVPQFYGYYQIDRANSPESTDSLYYSPILLVEECGESVDPDKLNADDFEECISLMYRFHAEGWTHGSIYRRNIVRQPGPLRAHPFIRQGDAHHRAKNRPWGTQWSFRLIDFGRSETMDTADNYWDYRENTAYEKEKITNIRLGTRSLA